MTYIPKYLFEENDHEYIDLLAQLIKLPDQKNKHIVTGATGTWSVWLNYPYLTRPSEDNDKELRATGLEKFEQDANSQIGNSIRSALMLPYIINKKIAKVWILRQY